jgi:hypothetical protein
MASHESFKLVPLWVDFKVKDKCVPLFVNLISISARVCGDWVKQKFAKIKNKLKLSKSLQGFKCFILNKKHFN